MTLADWLNANAISYAAFARTIEVSGAKVVERYAKRERIPEPPIMRRIVAVTDGAVQPNDFYLEASEQQGGDKIGHAQSLPEGQGDVSAEPEGAGSAPGAGLDVAA